MNVAAVDDEATRWMRQGIALFEIETDRALDEAIECFDRAIALRRQILAHGDSAFAYGLAAGLLNRGDALLRRADLPGAEQETRPVLIRLALRAFDEGVGLLSTLPWQTDPQVRRRLAVAWQNRALALTALGDHSRDEVSDSFEEALTLLMDPRAEEIADRRPMLATVWTNLANLWLDRANRESQHRAKQAALAALEHVDPALAEVDVFAAETAIKARYVLCRALATALTEAVDADETAMDAVHQATDAVDEGLALARRWEQKGIDRFRDLAADLVRFGSRVYARYQPQFLNEFVIENLDPAASSGNYVGSARMRIAALEALWLSFSRSERGRR